MVSADRGRDSPVSSVGHFPKRMSSNSFGFVVIESTPLLQAQPVPPVGRVSRWLQGITEALVIVLATAAPWAFGAIHPISVFVIDVGLSAVFVLVSIRVVIDRRVNGWICPIAAVLAGMVLLGVWQSIPLPAQVLSAVAPGTAALRADLLPTKSEAVVGDPIEPADTGTISFVPDATRQRTLKLLAVLGLVVVTRFTLAGPESFRRLAIAAVVNGSLLSLFAIVQKFTSPSHVVYWFFESQGSVYGPFICRNHFPYYVNICTGLGLGLLFGTRTFAIAHRDGWRVASLQLGRNPAALWLLAAVGLMAAATALSLSRGGILSLAAAVGFGGILWVVSTRRAAGALAMAAALTVGIGFVAWLGLDRVANRLDTLGTGEALAEGRGPMWARVLPMARSFPVFGTGFGSFEAVELMSRTPGVQDSLVWDHAHNDYLEGLIEGGGVQLGLMFALVLATVVLGVRGFLRVGDLNDRSLTLGGLVGLIAVAVHSVSDFGLHYPAIAMLAAIVAGHLSRAGQADTTLPVPRGVGILCMALAVGVGWVLVNEGWTRQRAEWYRLAAVRAAHRLPQGYDGPVADYLTAAVTYAPGDAALRLRLADVLYSKHAAHRAADRDGDGIETLLRPALREYLTTRRGNPLLATPHFRLAGNRDQLTNASSVSTYLERACRLEPANVDFWYLAGMELSESGNNKAAAAAWKSSLICSPKLLPAIVSRAVTTVGVDGLVDSILPDDPAILLSVAKHATLRSHPEERTALLVRAARIFADQPAETADETVQHARLLRQLGRVDEAVTTYERAIDKDGGRLEWRFEVAELLLAQGRGPDARTHLRRALEIDPTHPGARALHAEIVRDQVSR